MIAQLLFSVLLLVVLLYAWTAYQQAPIVGFAAMLAGLAGMYFVWLPAHAMAMAGWVGIGRGVDLIMYIWVVISVIVFLNLHIKIRTQTELTTRLTRAIAIADALGHGSSGSVDRNASVGSEPRQTAERNGS